MNDITIHTADTGVATLLRASINQIIAPTGTPDAPLFQLRAAEQFIQELADWMPVADRKNHVFGRSASQSTDRTMSLAMISRNPYNNLKQCLAKIESRRQALSATTFTLKRNSIQLSRKRDQLMRKTEELRDRPTDRDLEYDIAELNLDIEELENGVRSAEVYYEGALKEIKVYKDAYQEICKNHNIPDNWGEAEYVAAEVEQHVKTAVNHAVRNLISTGTLNEGTLEYLEQWGINPVAARTLCQQYLNNMQSVLAGTPKLEENGLQQRDVDGNLLWDVPPHIPPIESLYAFEDQMLDVFKDAWKSAWRRTGLDVDEFVKSAGLWQDS